MRSGRFCGIAPLAGLAAGLLAPLPAWPAPFRTGDVFVGVNQDRILHLDARGDLEEVLEGALTGEQTGMCFDADGHLYATSFTAGTMSRFDSSGRRLSDRWGGPFSRHPESCVVDRAGHIYTGEVGGEERIRKFDREGRLLATFRPATEARGVDWIDLAADQCTLFYTSEGNQVMRYDVCRDRQLPTFATLTGPCFALRLRENDELMVACQQKVFRLDRQGGHLRVYPFTGESLFALNLDPDGEHFWTAGQLSGDVYRVHIESGAGSESPRLHAARPRASDGSLLDRLREFLPIQGSEVGGLAIYGERTVAVDVRPPALPPEPPAETAAEPPPPDREEPTPSPAARVAFGPPMPVRFGRLAQRAQQEGWLDLSAACVQGRPELRLTTDLDLDRVVLEVDTGAGWRALGRQPLVVRGWPAEAGSWPLRLRVGSCPQATAPGDAFHILVEAGGAAPLRVPLELTVIGEPWLACWWPVLATAAALLTAAVLLNGFLSASRFPPHLGVVLSPEEDLAEGFFHPIRAVHGSRRRFYHDARVFVRPDCRLSGKPAGTLARLRADGARVRLRPVSGATLWRQTVDGSWEAMSGDEVTARFGVAYKNDLESLFFEIRNG